MHRFATQTLAITALITTAFISGCGKKEVKPDESALPSTIDADVNSMGDSDNGKANGLQTINFPYDSFVLDSSAKQKLKANADLLKEKSSFKIQVEGHCDERGGIQYNLALGEKRANAVRSYMAEIGINTERMSTISFGKERLLDPAGTDEAHAKNRRANFVVTGK